MKTYSIFAVVSCPEHLDRRPLGLGGRGTTRISTDPSGPDFGRAWEEDPNVDVSSRVIHVINVQSIFKSIFSQGVTNVFSLLLITFLLFASISGVFAALSTNAIAPTSVNICESNRFAAYINNTGTTPENDILLNVTIPSGFSYESGTTGITFPDGSSSEDPQIDGPYLEWNLTDIMTTETGVVINEVLPNPLGSDGSNERVELYNAGSTSVNVSGWSIKDEANNTRDIESYLVSGSVEMAPGSFLVVSMWRLDNDGDTVFLFNDTDVQKDSVTYGTSVEGESWACMPDGSELWNWR
ncbi:lamin tail domain-containing protein, partial [Methanocrinis sp.]|uniref:lamin tail domain-containing protein n=1 Tax=Methanocrinis sp. TaxID=3101522 RepID=UPI003D12297C